jgi:hypothetical protein
MLGASTCDSKRMRLSLTGTKMRRSKQVLASNEESQVETALRILLRADNLAHDSGCDPLEFAVELEEFHHPGVSLSILRWLVRTGQVQHVIDVTSRNAKRRSFRAAPNLCLDNQSCFALTRNGMKFARMVLGNAIAGGDQASDRPATELPRWDFSCNTLFLGSAVVKRFKQGACNQQLILAEFQRLGWPPRIDDPLPLSNGHNPKQKLRDTIKRLNRAQVHRLVHFFGTNRGIGWEIIR